MPRVNAGVDGAGRRTVLSAPPEGASGGGFFPTRLPRGVVSLTRFGG